jgi:hypothetical protein
MYRITSRMSSMALTLSGKAKRAGKGPYLPRSTASVPERHAHTYRRLLHGC